MGAHSSKKKKNASAKDKSKKVNTSSYTRSGIYMEHEENGSEKVNMITAMPRLKHDINFDNDMTGIAILDDGRLLVSKNGTRSVLLITKNGKVLAFMTLSDYTWGIKMIDSVEGAVVVQNECLHFFTVKRLSLVKGKTLNVPVLFDFAFHDNFYYIGGEKRIMVYNNSLGHERDIPVTDDVGYIAIRDNTSLCFTVWGKRDLYCISMDGTPIFTYSHDTLRGTVGVTVDHEGYIYVCGYITKNVHKVSRDGNLQSVIFHNLPERPYCICVNRRNYMLVVGCIRKVLVFKME